MIHLPVMVEEAIEYLNVQKGKWYVDCTLGAGGHSLEILKRGGKVLGIDQDEEVLDLAKKSLSDYHKRIVFEKRNFIEVGEVIKKHKIKKVFGALYDLGLSSYQIEKDARGFSFQREGPLDMRMDLSKTTKCADIINRGREEELARILKEYGEERMSRRIAREIVKNRPIRTTTGLASLVARAIGKRGKIHPATRTFQALRIAVNDELSALTESLDSIFPHLASYGRIVVISFHSLEDRIVKRKFKQWQKEEVFKILTKKPLRPTPEEIEENPRARSAKFRGGEKV
ncbi:MAG: 16S rRNA (cytosine(1402)-N(4))-methyltransferase RsmH [bacterium]|nr:16S rRNA (cytosine(1402)-N(4))-methyltransferase RsmH [bacterium]